MATKNENLTSRQQQVLDVIIRLMQKNRQSPTVREIAAELEINIHAVTQHLILIEAKEAIVVRGNKKSRSIEVVGFCPLCGAKKE